MFAVVGYLLLGSALFFELTEFHPLLENFFGTYTEHSLAGGGPERTGAAVNGALTSIHQWPLTLLWLKLDGVGHILLGIFIALAAIVRALALMPPDSPTRWNARKTDFSAGVRLRRTNYPILQDSSQVQTFR